MVGGVLFVCQCHVLEALVAHDSGGRCAFCVIAPCADVTCVLVFVCTMVESALNSNFRVACLKCVGLIVFVSSHHERSLSPNTCGVRHPLLSLVSAVVEPKLFPAVEGEEYCR